MNIDEILEAARAVESAGGLFKDGFEGYFDQHKQRTKVTDGDFSRAPQLERQEFIELNEIHPEGLDLIVNNLESSYSSLFDQWALELAQNFNLCLYGIGSKLELVSLFLDHWNPDMVVVVANAFNPLDFKEMLNFCVKAVVPEDIVDGWFKLPNERITQFLAYLDEHPETELTLVIHSVESETLRDSKSMDMLGRLVSHKQIFFIATCTNIMAPVIWNAHQAALLGFVWHNVTTFRPAISENASQDVTKFGKTGAQSVRVIDMVLKSLTKNARALFKLLAKMQHSNMKRRKLELSAECKPSHGVAWNDLLDECLAEFIVSSEDSLRRLMAEYTSHKLVRSSNKNTGGVDMYYIPGSFGELVEILALA